MAGNRTLGHEFNHCAPGETFTKARHAIHPSPNAIVYLGALNDGGSVFLRTFYLTLKQYSLLDIHTLRSILPWSQQLLPDFCIVPRACRTSGAGETKQRGVHTPEEEEHFFPSQATLFKMAGNNFGLSALIFIQIPPHVHRIHCLTLP